MSEYRYPNLDGLTKEAQEEIKRLFREMTDKINAIPEKKPEKGVISLDGGDNGAYSEITNEYMQKIMAIKVRETCSKTFADDHVLH